MKREKKVLLNIECILRKRESVVAYSHLAGFHITIIIVVVVIVSITDIAAVMFLSNLWLDFVDLIVWASTGGEATQQIKMHTINSSKLCVVYAALFIDDERLYLFIRLLFFLLLLLFCLLSLVTWMVFLLLLLFISL